MTDSDDPAQMLTDRAREMSEGLPPELRPAYVGAVAAAFTHGHRLAADSLDPRHDVEAGAVALLLLAGSTRSTDARMAAALVETARAHAALWALTNEVAAFRHQLDALDPR